MLVQVLDAARDAAFLQVARAGAEHAVDGAEGLGDVLGVGQFAVAGDHHVLAFLEDVRLALGQGQLDVDLGVQLAIARDQRNQVLLAKAGQRMHPQPPTRTQVRAAGFRFRLVHFADDLPAALQVALAGLGKRQAPGGAVQQPRLEVRFQVRDDAGNLCGG
ncbi:hypothetical protein D3C81_1421430 [compost metagenome]